MGDFPNLDNVNVYKYDNLLDYSLFKPTARLKMCNVPWCGDYDNVVKFDDDAARDAGSTRSRARPSTSTPCSTSSPTARPRCRDR